MNPRLLHAAAASALVLAGVIGALQAQEPAAALSPTQKAFQVAEKAYQEGRWQDALNACIAFRTNYTYSTLYPQVVYYQAWTEFQLDKKTNAIASLDYILTNRATSAIAPAALLKKAEIQRDLKDWVKAVESFREFQKKFPDDALLTQAYLGEAWTFFRKWTADKKDKKESAEDLARAKQVAIAVREGRVKRDEGARLDALFLLGQVYTTENNYDEARKIYEEIRKVRNNPRATDALFLAGEAMWDAQKYNDAIGYYARVRSKLSLVADIREQIKQLQARIPKEPENRSALQSAIAGLNQTGQQIAAKDDLRPLALFRTGNCYQSLEMPEEAAIIFRHFRRLYPDHPLAPQCHFALTQALTAAGRPQEAEMELADFKKKYPDKKDFTQSATFLDAKAKFDSGNFEKALPEFRDFLSKNTDVKLKETAEFYIAACFIGLQRFPEARDAFTKFIADYPKSQLLPDAYFRLGRTHFEISQKDTESAAKEKNLTAAVQNYEIVRREHPREDLLSQITFQLGYLNNYLAQIETERKEKEKARGFVEKSVVAFQEFATKWADNPLAPEAAFQAANMQLDPLGKIDESVAGFRQIVAKYGDTKFGSAASFGVARAYATAKKSDEMVAALREFIVKYPEHDLVSKALLYIGDDLRGRKPPQVEPATAAYRQLIGLAAKKADASDELLADALRAQARMASDLEAAEKPKEAAAEWAGFLEQFKDRPATAREAVTQIATVWRNAKKPEEAAAALTALATKYQQVSAIRIAAGAGLIELALTRKDLQGAYAAALKLQADPDKDKLSCAAFIAIGNAMLKNQKFAQAADSFDAVLQRCKEDQRSLPLALSGHAQALFRLNKLPEAQAAIESLLQSYKGHSAVCETLLTLGRIYESQGKNKEAVDAYNEVVRCAKGETMAEASLQLGNFFLLKDKDCKTAIPYYLRVTVTVGGAMGEEASFRVAQAQECLITQLTDPNQKLAARQGAFSAYSAYVKRFPEGRFAAEAKEGVTRTAPPPAPK